MNIFGYYNYRKYLQDFYEFRKSVHRHFSYRAFAQKAGYVSAGLFLDLVKGRKNLTDQLIPKFVKALGLNEREAQYFALMVDFTHATAPEPKQEIFEKMAAMLPRSMKILTRNQKEYFSKWYYVAVRESLGVLNISDNYQDLALFLVPRISVPQAKQAINLLSDLEIIAKVDGIWRSRNTTVSSGTDVDPLMVHQFQKEMIDLGKNAITHFSRERRNISCTTMSVSPVGLERIIGKIDIFRREIIEIVRSDEGERMVCQLNVQFFPLSKEKES